MRINTNVSSLIAQENAVNTNSKIQSSLEKLSSGLKINKASDDASGLAIADKLRTQATSIKQGVANGNSAVTLLQIADKSMAEQSNILDVVKAKLIQANTDTTSDDGREAIRKDIKKLLEQLDNIAEQTNYNGTKLLDTTANVVGSTSSSGSSSSSSSSSTQTLTSQTLSGGSATYNGLINGATNYDLTFTSSDYFDTEVAISGTGGVLTNNGTGPLNVVVNTGSATETFLLSLGSDVALGGNFGAERSYTVTNGYDIDFGNNSFEINSIYKNSGVSTESFGYSGGVVNSLGTAIGSGTDVTISGTATVTSTSTTSGSSGQASDLLSSGLSFQIGESSDDLINTSNIQSNTLDLGGGNEALVQASGASNQNNQIASNESMIFSIGDDNSATIDANTGITNVNISGEVETLTMTDASGTLSNLDEATYTLLNALANDMDGVSGSETVGGITVSLSDGATLSKSGGSFTLSNGGSLTFSDGYEIASMDVQEGSASGSISVSNASDVLVTNLSDSATVAITSSASGSLTGGQTLISLKNLSAGELTKDKSYQFQSVVDSAISGLNALRGEIGSTQNQVESAVRNLLTQHTNVKAAESIIRDVDYANESGNFNKQSIIAQAGSYAITQANSTQQNILRLLN